MSKAIFLDRDGTINVEKCYLYKIEDFEFLPGVIEGLKLLQGAGYCLIIVTNQSGIGRGYYLEEDFIKLDNWMEKELEQYGIHISKTYYCPHIPDAPIEKYRKNCICRKPALGMYEQAVREFDIDLAQSFAIGDRIRDCSICEKTPCRGYLIAKSESAEVLAKVQNAKYTNIEYAFDLLDAAKKIVKK